MRLSDAPVLRYRLYQWRSDCPGPGWHLVVELDKGQWVNRLWGHA